MMIGRLGVRHEARHEIHRRGKVGKGELLPDRVAVEGPSVEARQPLLGLAPGHLHGFFDRISSSRSLAASTASRLSFCNSIAFRPSAGLPNALPAMAR